jgi:hypothetical protein
MWIERNIQKYKKKTIKTNHLRKAKPKFMGWSKDYCAEGIRKKMFQFVLSNF